MGLWRVEGWVGGRPRSEGAGAGKGEGLCAPAACLCLLPSRLPGDAPSRLPAPNPRAEASLRLRAPPLRARAEGPRRRPRLSSRLRPWSGHPGPRFRPKSLEGEAGRAPVGSGMEAPRGARRAREGLSRRPVAAPGTPSVPRRCGCGCGCGWVGRAMCDRGPQGAAGALGSGDQRGGGERGSTEGVQRLRGVRGARQRGRPRGSGKLAVASPLRAPCARRPRPRRPLSSEPPASMPPGDTRAFFSALLFLNESRLMGFLLSGS